MANSAAPDEMARTNRLIWIYTVYKTFFSGRRVETFFEMTVSVSLMMIAFGNTLSNENA